MPKFITSIRLQGANEKIMRFFSGDEKKILSILFLKAKRIWPAVQTQLLFLIQTAIKAWSTQSNPCLAGCGNDRQKIFIHPF
jgi:hypothetical protein